MADDSALYWANAMSLCRAKRDGKKLSRDADDLLREAISSACELLDAAEPGSVRLSAEDVRALVEWADCERCGKLGAADAALAVADSLREKES